MLASILVLIFAGCVVAYWRWRFGIVAALLIGLIQDPIRKMVPDAPAYLALSSLPVWLAVVGAAVWSGEVSISRFLELFPRLTIWLRRFFAYLLLPILLSATNGPQTWQIALMGTFLYALTFFLILAGRVCPCRQFTLRRILTIYAILTSIILVGGPLDRLGWGSRFAAISTEAMGHIWVTYRTGAAVYMLAGFFRGPDVMGWHASLVFMISVILASRTWGWLRYLWITVSVWGALNMWLCGRRKMLSMIPIFLGCYLLLIYKFQNARRVVPVAGLFLMILGLGWYGIGLLNPDSATEAFYFTAIHEAGSQWMQHSVDSVRITLQQAGFFGYGLGMAQQGIHHIQGDRPEIWQESGPGKLIVELGIPGTLLFLVMGWTFFQTSLCALRRKAEDPSFYLYAGLLSILIANGAAALISAQIYGDPFIASLVALMIGLLLSSAPSRPPQEDAPCPS